MDKAEGQRQEVNYPDRVAWESRKKAVMERSKGICEGCGWRRAEHVHHLTYEHVGNELLWELVAVCGECFDRVNESGNTTPPR